MKTLLFCIISIFCLMGADDCSGKEREYKRIRREGGSCVYNYNTYNYACVLNGTKYLCDGGYSCVVVDSFSAEAR